MPYNAKQLAAARVRVSDALREATRKHVENTVPKLDAGQLRYYGQHWTPAFMDAAIKQNGTASVDQFLQRVNEATKAEG